MSYVRQLFKQSSFYFTSQILLMFAGLVSFPIWTRILSKSEYGIFSLIGVTISLGVGFSKFGIQHAALRYHADFKEKTIGLDMKYYYTTLFMGSLLISSALILATVLIAKTSIIPFIDKSLVELLPLVALLIFIGSLSSILTMFIRADNRAGLHSIFAVGKRYGRLIFALVIVFYFMKNLKGLFLGYALSEIIILVVLIMLFIKKINLTKMSLSFLKEAIKYGFPLIWMELSNMLLNFGDRYLIKFYSGAEAVGVYSAGYNVSNMVQSFLVSPMRLAVIPMYLKIWSRDGEGETQNFLSTTLNYYFMAGIPIIIGMSWFGEEIITLLASSKYKDSAVIIPYIIFALVLYGANPIFAAGLRIHKRTVKLMSFSMPAALINLLLNTMLIPKFGISGAAYATLISYIILISMVVIVSSKHLKIRLNLTLILKYLLLSTSVVLAISYLPTAGMKELVVKFLLGLMAYIVGIIFIDRTIRLKLASIIKNKKFL